MITDQRRAQIALPAVQQAIASVPAVRDLLLRSLFKNGDLPGITEVDLGNPDKLLKSIKRTAGAQ